MLTWRPEEEIPQILNSHLWLVRFSRFFFLFIFYLVYVIFNIFIMIVCYSCDKKTGAHGNQELPEKPEDGQLTTDPVPSHLTITRGIFSCYIIVLVFNKNESRTTQRKEKDAFLLQFIRNPRTGTRKHYRSICLFLRLLEDLPQLRWICLKHWAHKLFKLLT